MVLGYPLSISRRAVILRVKPIGVHACPAAKEEFIVDLHELFFPESIFIQDIA